LDGRFFLTGARKIPARWRLATRKTRLRAP